MQACTWTKGCSRAALLHLYFQLFPETEISSFLTSSQNSLCKTAKEINSIMMLGSGNGATTKNFSLRKELLPRFVYPQDSSCRELFENIRPFLTGSQNFLGEIKKVLNKNGAWKYMLLQFFLSQVYSILVLCVQRNLMQIRLSPFPLNSTSHGTKFISCR